MVLMCLSLCTFSYIAPEQLPVKYGGLSKDGEFANTDAVTEITVRAASKHTVEFPVTEVGFPLLFSGQVFENPKNSASEWGIFHRIPCSQYFMPQNVQA